LLLRGNSEVLKTTENVGERINFTFRFISEA
jgi:hypothetical protein